MGETCCLFRKSSIKKENLKMKVKIAYGTEVFEVPNCSKAMLVSKFKKLVEKATDVQPKFQQLIFGGKIFNDKNDLCDYKIEDGYKIMLLKREPFGELSNSQSPKKMIVKEEKEEGKKKVKTEVKTEVKEEAMEEIMEEIKQEKNEDV